MSLCGPTPDHQSPGGAGGLLEEELVRNMMALDDGLHRIEQQSPGRLILLYEDPETFGAGHFVLCPSHGSSPRFAIEEQYPPGVDWSDENRVPVSWTWASEARLPQPDGSWPWLTLAQGEVAAADYESLLHITAGWADALRELIAREEALTTDPITEDRVGLSGRGRTFLT